MSSRDRDLLTVLGRLASLFDGSVLGVALAVAAGASWYKYSVSSSALKRISDAPSVKISDLRDLLSFSDDGENNHGAGDDRIVVVRGEVQPKPVVDVDWFGSSKPQGVITANGSDVPAVVSLSTTTCLYNEWRGIFGWNVDLHTIFVRSWREQQSAVYKSVPFLLMDQDNQQNPVYVLVNLDKISHPLPLTRVHHQLHSVRTTPFTLFQALFGYGYPVALLDEEKILKVGAEITAIGTCKIQDGNIEIKSCEDLPYFLSDMTKDEIVSELGFDTSILYWSGFLLAGLSAGLLGYAISRNWRKWKSWRERRRREIEDLRNEPLDSRTEQEDVPDGQLCVICLSVLRTSAFIPCGHLVCCRRCAMSVELDSSPKCPVCRQTIRSSLRIYDS